MQFWGKFGKIVCWRPLLEGWRPHLGEILDLPLFFHVIIIYKAERQNFPEDYWWFLDYYHPQTKLQKGNVFTSVCQEFFPQGSVCQTPPGQTPPLGQTPPWADTPWHTPQADTPQQMATAADGTHPTGMHSCCLLFQPKKFPHFYVNTLFFFDKKWQFSATKYAFNPLVKLIEQNQQFKTGFREQYVIVILLIFSLNNNFDFCHLLLNLTDRKEIYKKTFFWPLLKEWPQKLKVPN